MRGSLAKRIRRNTDFMTMNSKPVYASIPMSRMKPDRLSVVLVECDRALYKAVKRSVLVKRRAA